MGITVRILAITAYVVLLSAGSMSRTETRAATNGQSLRPTDELLEQLVRSALAADPVTESYETVVTVVDGKLILHGAVDTDEERDRAGSVAADVEGVTEVENEITVQRRVVPQDRSDAEIRRAIQDDIERDYPDETIDAHVEDAFATFTGTVSSEDDRRRLSEIAFEAGALLVKNEIRVESE